MRLMQIVKMVGGSILTMRANLDLDIKGCGASDLMSDVLSYMEPGSLLVTGLVNAQCIRTAEVADLAAIIFVRGKRPVAETVDLADELGIPLIASPYSMYEMCGRLFQAGLLPFTK